MRLRGLRGDTALWILTKMAMLFFIMSLAAILMFFSNAQRTSLCKANAQQIADSIGGTIATVMQSPIEDERRVIKLPPSLAIGEGQASRYYINITKYKGDAVSNRLVVGVNSLSDPTCSAGKSVSYPASFDLPANNQMRLVPQDGSGVATAPAGAIKFIGGINLFPSFSARNSFRSQLIGILKCSEKKTARRVFFFIQDCPDGACLDVPSGTPGSDDVSMACGFQ